jgi:hypothetical protein
MSEIYFRFTSRPNLPQPSEKQMLKPAEWSPMVCKVEDIHILANFFFHRLHAFLQAEARFVVAVCTFVYQMARN